MDIQVHNATSHHVVALLEFIEKHNSYNYITSEHLIRDLSLHKVYIACDSSSEELQGMLSVVCEEDGYYIKRLLVAEHGKGIATKLFDLAELRYTVPLTVTPLPSNEKMVQFLEKRGYIEGDTTSKGYIQYKKG